MNKRKLLLVGANGFNRNDEENILKCYNWNNIDRIENVRDYDVIIINLIETDNLSDLDINDVEHLFNFKNAYDISKTHGKIIIVGDPRKKIPMNTDNDLFKNQKDNLAPITFFTGMKFSWDNNPGDTVIPSFGRSQEYIGRYVQNLNKWKYSLFSITPNEEVISQVFDIKKLSEINFEVIKDKTTYCHNRYNNSLIFSVKLKAVEQDRYGPGNGEMIFSNILMLPEISLNKEATIELILEDICNLKAPLEEPEWIENYKAPKQREIDKQIERVEDKIRSNYQELSKLKKDLKVRRKCLKLFYESGKELEEVVLDILTELGADVEKPTELGKEDGWIYVETESDDYSGVLEIKGTKNVHFNDKGRKQLLDWVDRGITLRQTKYKGIFIGNSSKEKDPRDRKNPYADNWIKSSELSEIAALTTVQLFIVYSKLKTNEIDIDGFWKTLFETDGPVGFEDLLQDQE
jgi:hypothetical protein